jgi:hypothetical protein
MKGKTEYKSFSLYMRKGQSLLCPSENPEILLQVSPILLPIENRRFFI